jgi:hypothetical protein
MKEAAAEAEGVLYADALKHLFDLEDVGTPRDPG